MIAWLIYLNVVACVASAAGLLAELGLRLLGRPVRWAWAGAMTGTVAVSMLATAGVAPGVARIAIAAPAAGGPSFVDVVLVGGWAAVTLVLLASVRLSSWTVRRNERSWRRIPTAAHATVVSTSFGPGVIGARRPRIVLPEWVLGAAPSLKDLIVRHEEEHVRARDTTVVMGAVAIVVLLPWCLPLWWQLHRLRTAVEIDCDARVLAATQRPREYARALLEVAGRRRPGLLPAPPFALGGDELERRVRIITGRGRGRSPVAGAGLVFAAAALMGIAAGIAAPGLPTLTIEPGPGMAEPRPAAVLYLQMDADPAPTMSGGAPQQPVEGIVDLR